LSIFVLDSIQGTLAARQPTHSGPGIQRHPGAWMRNVVWLSSGVDHCTLAGATQRKENFAPQL
jgi:hypothetical protein